MKKEIEKILYQNSTDCSDGLIIDFNKIDFVIDEICKVKTDAINLCDSNIISEFLEWIDTENEWSRRGLDWYKYEVNFGLITIKYEELYKEFLNQKTK